MCSKREFQENSTPGINFFTTVCEPFCCLGCFLTKFWFGEIRLCFIICCSVFKLPYFCNLFLKVCQTLHYLLSFILSLLTLYFTKISFSRKRKLQYCMRCVTVCDIGWLFFPCALLPAKVLLFSSLHLTHSKKIVSRWHFLGIMCQHESSEM